MFQDSLSNRLVRKRQITINADDAWNLEDYQLKKEIVIIL